MNAWTSCRVLGLVLTIIAGSAGGAAAQLASRPVGEWQRLLDSPERIAALKVDEVVARLALKPGDVVADLGAGTGPFVVAFAKAVPSGAVYAVEIDKDFLPLIAERARAAGLGNVTPVLGEYGDPKLPGPVDVAFMHDVLHHIADRPAYLRALVRYLKPGARVAIIDYEADRSPHAGQAQMVVSRSQARELFASAGLKVVEEVKLFDDKWFVVFGR
jgi:ubiquinone/menaquinone biosynthesis C-methylase UbiE